MDLTVFYAGSKPVFTFDYLHYLRRADPLCLLVLYLNCFRYSRTERVYYLRAPAVICLCAFSGGGGGALCCLSQQ